MPRTWMKSTDGEWIQQAGGERCLYVGGVKVACVYPDGTLKTAGDVRSNETL